MIFMTAFRTYKTEVTGQYSRERMVTFTDVSCKSLLHTSPVKIPITKHRISKIVAYHHIIIITLVI